jgi:hypothetical protein
LDWDWGLGIEDFFVGDDDFSRLQTLDFALQLILRVVAVELGNGELACGDVTIRKSCLIALRRQTREIVVAFRFEHGGFDDGTGRDHAHDLALHESVLRLVTRLLADGNLVPFGDKARDVILGGVVWHTCHRDAFAFRDGARGQHQIEFAGDELRVVVKRLVEIAQAKEDDDMGISFFDAQILRADRGSGHEKMANQLEVQFLRDTAWRICSIFSRITSAS